MRDAAAMPLREYFSADQVAVRIRMKEEGSSRDIVVASVYMPFDSNDPQRTSTGSYRTAQLGAGTWSSDVTQTHITGYGAALTSTVEARPYLNISWTRRWTF